MKGNKQRNNNMNKNRNIKRTKKIKNLNTIGKVKIILIEVVGCHQASLQMTFIVMTMTFMMKINNK